MREKPNQRVKILDFLKTGKFISEIRYRQVNSRYKVIAFSETCKFSQTEPASQEKL